MTSNDDQSFAKPETKEEAIARFQAESWARFKAENDEMTRRSIMKSMAVLEKHLAHAKAESNGDVHIEARIRMLEQRIAYKKTELIELDDNTIDADDADGIVSVYTGKTYNTEKDLAHHCATKYPAFIRTQAGLFYAAPKAEGDNFCSYVDANGVEVQRLY